MKTLDSLLEEEQREERYLSYFLKLTLEQTSEEVKRSLIRIQFDLLIKIEKELEIMFRKKPSGARIESDDDSYWYEHSQSQTYEYGDGVS